MVTSIADADQYQYNPDHVLLVNPLNVTGLCVPGTTHVVSKFSNSFSMPNCPSPVFYCVRGPYMLFLEINL